jgi:hypothetical protein
MGRRMKEGERGGADVSENARVEFSDNRRL